MPQRFIRACSALAVRWYAGKVNCFFFSSRRRHTICLSDWSSDVCSSDLAELIRAKIRAQTGLTASAGVSYNKFLAKLASDHRKPDGLFVITPAMGPTFVESLKVERFHGVWPATAAKMNRLGIFTALDLRAHDQ